ncbi:MAG TPA: hypothetical protein DCS66_17450 [Flavobacteriaceae bacterium]|nr:hypothetical protein [Flavobacteriaceae bacterium]
MKLNEYIHKKLLEIRVLHDPIGALTPSDIERWVIDWYMGEFNEIGCGKGKKPRAPPSWLANWRKNE